jgi:hypothetical protein
MYLCFLEKTINEFPFLAFKKGKDALEKNAQPHHKDG